jgi:uncharacterized OsmC-like protein
MRVFLHSETELTLSELHQPGVQLEHAPDRHVPFSALQMFATSLGLCTGSVMLAYSRQLQVGVDGLQVHLRWKVVPDPLRVDDIEMDIRWPELPESRLKAAERAAKQCTIHNTLSHPPQLRTTVLR